MPLHENGMKHNHRLPRAQYVAAAVCLLALTVPLTVPAYGTYPSAADMNLLRPIRFHLTPLFLSKPETIRDPEAKSFHTILGTLILEAVGEGHTAMVAVGEVIRNRSVLFVAAWDQICASPYQFSGWNDRKRALNFLAEHKSYYSAAIDAWDESAFTDYTRGATEYHAKYVRPRWARDYKRTARIGSHIFYRRPAVTS